MWKLLSGEVVVDRLNSHIHEGVAGLLSEALGLIDPTGRPFIAIDIDLGRVVGETICVPTGPGDEIVWAVRPNRAGHTRFVVGRSPLPTTKVTVVLKQRNEGGYVLITAFVGPKAEPEPWDRNATPASRQYWASRALVYGSEPTLPGTETTICPW